MDELRNRGADDSDRHKILSILQKFHEETAEQDFNDIARPFAADVYQEGLFKWSFGCT
jgi:hypothetical protein